MDLFQFPTFFLALMMSLDAITTSKGNAACIPLLLHLRLFLTQFTTFGKSFERPRNNLFDG